MILFISFTFLFLYKELNSLSSVDEFLSLLLDQKISPSLAATLLFFLILFVPFLFCLFIIVNYKKHGFNFKKPVSVRYHNLCSMFYYSLLRCTTTNTFALLDLISSSRIIYFIIRMSQFFGKRDQSMICLFKFISNLFLNSLSFMIIFFLYETYISFYSSSVPISLYNFARKNKIVIGLFFIITLVYFIIINHFSSKYYLLTLKSVVSYRETLWSGFCISALLNAFTMCFYLFAISDN